LSEAVANPVRITFSRIVCSSPERLNHGFLTEGKLAAIFIKPSLGVFQLAGYLLHQLGSITHIHP
jgi:hypothetical protein